MSEIPSSSAPLKLLEEYSDNDQIPNEYAELALDSLVRGEGELLDSYIAQGADKMAFLIPSPEHQDVPRVLKVIKRPIGHMETVEEAEYIKKKTLESAASLLQGEGVDNLEQLLAIDTDRGLLVTTYHPGKMIAEMSSKELYGIKKKHLLQLEQTLQQMREKGLHYHNAGGILFDIETGFSFVDYEADDTDKWNRGDIDTIENFLFYALADFKKLEQLAVAKSMGMSVPNRAFKTTGFRAAARRTVSRRARRAVKGTSKITE